MRCLITIPACLLAFVLAAVTAPVWIAVGWTIDRLSRGRTAALRCFAFFTYYVTCEVAGVVALAPFVLASYVLPSRSRLYRGWLKSLHASWATAQFRGLAGLYDLRLVQEGEDQIEPAPLLVLLRHSSAGDTLYPPVLLSGGHRILCRYILKSELRWDPFLDITSSLSPHVFIHRDSEHRDEDLERIAGLIEDLRDDEAVVIWPEGTRHTREKREKLLTRLEEKGEEELLAYARGLQHVLPPRPGGTQTLLERNPGADVLIVRHTGWEGIATFGDLWRGSFVGRTLRVNFQRVPYSEIPRTREGMRGWLFERWRELDAWVDERRYRPGGVP